MSFFSSTVAGYLIFLLLTSSLFHQLVHFLISDLSYESLWEISHWLLVFSCNALNLTRTDLCDWVWVWVYIISDVQSVRLSWNKAPIWGLRPDFYYFQTIAGLLMWGAPSDERTGLSFTTAASPRQSSHFRVRVPWDSWPYIVSDSRLPYLSPHTTCRATVEVFDPTSTQGSLRLNQLPCGPNIDHRLKGFQAPYLW
jgi:hypothetical protein